MHRCARSGTWRGVARRLCAVKNIEPRILLPLPFHSRKVERIYLPFTPLVCWLALASHATFGHINYASACTLHHHRTVAFCLLTTAGVPKFRFDGGTGTAGSAKQFSRFWTHTKTRRHDRAVPKLALPIDSQQPTALAHTPASRAGNLPPHLLRVYARAHHAAPRPWIPLPETETRLAPGRPPAAGLNSLDQATARRR